MPRLSVIVPCYNVASYLSETIGSLRRAYRPGMEFVLVDDGSTDGTGALLEELAPNLPGSRVLHHAVNRGLSAARNVGIDTARGQYLAFLDGDDFVAPDHYEQLLGAAERLGCDLLRTDHVQVRGRRRSVHRIPYGPRGVVGSPRAAILPVERMTSVDAPHAWAGVYSRRLADRGLLHFDEQLRTCEDRPWNWRLHLRARSFAVVGLVGHFYRRDVRNSLTQTPHRRQLDFLPAYDTIVAEVSADRDAAVLLPKALRAYAAMVCHHLSRVQPSQPADDESGTRGATDEVRDGFRYDDEQGVELRRLCVAAMRRLPQPELTGVLVAMDADRRAVLTGLLEDGR